MRGDLSETPVADLCRGLSAAGATGAVEVEGRAGDARLFFRAGNVYWAASPTPRARLGDRLVNAGLLTQEQLDETLEVQRSSDERTKLGALLVERGLVSRDAIRVFVLEQILDAVFEMVQWRDGTYVFNPGEVVEEKLPVDIPVDQLLVEVARRQSEWAQIQAVIPDLDMVPDFVRGGSSANAALEPDEFTVLANVDGARSIRELADHLGYSEFEAARIVYGLTLLGIIDVRGEADEGQETADDGAGAPEEPAVDIDVASALEAALAEAAGATAQGPAPSSERPRVKLHVDDDVSDYLPPRAAAGDAAPPEGAVEPEASVDELAAALSALGAEADEVAEPEEVAATSETPPSDGEDEPEPWVAGDDAVPAPTPTADLGFFAGATAPPSARSGDLPDDEFAALLDELSTSPDEAAGTEGDAEERDEVPARSHEPEPEVSTEPEPGPEPEPQDEGPPPAGRPAEAPRGPGDVSEFLRELSQLALDDPPAGAPAGPSGARPRPAAAEPAEAEAAGEDPTPPRPEERRPASADRTDDRNKKRGLFGWGR